MRAELGAVLTAGILVAGCSASPSGEDAPTRTQPPAVATETVPPLPQIPKIDLATLPDTLPAAVIAQENNVVAVTVDIPDGKKTKVGIIQYDSFALSGFRVGPSEYLSAGHGFLTGTDHIIPGVNKCGSIAIDAVGNATPSAASDDLSGNFVKNLYGAHMNVVRFAGSFISAETSNTPDISLLEAPDAEKQGIAFTGIKLATTPVKPGDQLYFVNYQPTASGETRTPDEADLDLSTDRNLGLNRPAIFGGIVVGKELNGNIDVADGLRGYSKPLEVFGRQGESGGPVLNKAGELVALSVRGTAKPTRADRFTTYTGINVQLTGIRPSQQVGLDILQPITPQLLAAYIQKLKASAECTPESQQ